MQARADRDRCVKVLSLWLVRPWMSSDRRLELSHGVAPQTPVTQPPRTPLCSPSTQQDRGPRWPPPPLLHSGKFLRAAGHGPSEAPCVRASKATALAGDGTVSRLRRHARATARSGTRLLSPTSARSVPHAAACRHGPLAVIVSSRVSPRPALDVLILSRLRPVETAVHILPRVFW